MWQLIKSCWNFFILLLLGLKNIAELFAVAAESIHLNTSILLNSIHIKNGNPLETHKELKDLSKLDKKTATYLYGVRLLQEQQESTYPLSPDMLLKQHQALEKFIDSLDKLPLQDDYSNEVRKLINKHHWINSRIIPTEKQLEADYEIALIQRNLILVDNLNKLKVKLGNDPAAVKVIDDKIALIKAANKPKDVSK